jgi:hypothetical protein
VVTAVVTLVIATSCDERDTPDGSQASPTPTQTAPAIEQARWDIRARATAAVHRLTRNDKGRIRAQKPELRKLVREVYRALFLSPEDSRAVILKRFTSRTASALIRSGAGIPNRLTDVKTTWRRARIGIGATSAHQAAAEVRIRARAMAGDNRVRILHRSTLWLQKKAGRWKAIAFEIKQGPAA